MNEVVPVIEAFSSEPYLGFSKMTHPDILAKVQNAYKALVTEGSLELVQPCFSTG